MFYDAMNNSVKLVLCKVCIYVLTIRVSCKRARAMYLTGKRVAGSSYDSYDHLS